MTPLQLRLAVGLFACAAAGCGTSNSNPPPGPPSAGGAAAALTGKLDVVVRRPVRASEPFVVGEDGALPVVPGGNMSLLVQLSEPAYCYLVWLDTEEQALPLYPWNIETLEVRDLAETPPVRQPAKTIYSPMLGGAWTFGERGGMDTVLLLARRTPLPKDVNLAELIKPLPNAAPDKPDELEILALDGGPKAPIAVLQPHAESSGSEQPAVEHRLAPFLAPLAEHFDLIRCIRFAHANEPSSTP